MHPPPPDGPPGPHTGASRPRAPHANAPPARGLGPQKPRSREAARVCSLEGWGGRARGARARVHLSQVPGAVLLICRVQTLGTSCPPGKAETPSTPQIRPSLGGDNLDGELGAKASSPGRPGRPAGPAIAPGGLGGCPLAPPGVWGERARLEGDTQFGRPGSELWEESRNRFQRIEVPASSSCCFLPGDVDLFQKA